MATAANIVHGSDKLLHTKIKGAMLKTARDFRDDKVAEPSEIRQRWARQVLQGNDSSYSAIVRELSLRQAIQDSYDDDDHAEGVVRTNMLAILDDAIASQLG